MVDEVDSGVGANGSVQSQSSQHHDKRKLVVVLTGPTAVGKSAVAERLVTPEESSTKPLLEGMIVSADSVQVYRDVSIGANKPSLAVQERCPHLLLSLVDNLMDCSSREMRADETAAPISPYNAAEWRRDALLCIHELLQVTSTLDDRISKVETSATATTLSNMSEWQDQKRQKTILDSIYAAREKKGFSPTTPVTPVFVGGTMMYLQWLVDGRPDAMPASPSALAEAKTLIQKMQDELKLEQQQENQADGIVVDDATKWKNLVLELSQHYGEPFASQFSKLSFNDWYRLRRILEVVLTVKEQNGMQPDNIYSGQRDGGLLQEDDTFDVRCFFLCPTNRQAHCRIIDDRCEQMLENGLITETTRLATEVYTDSCIPGMIQKAIGYRQVLDYLGRENPVENDTDAFDEFLESFKGATRRYAKRQTQWFRKDDTYVFVPVDVENAVSNMDEVLDELVRLLTMPRPEYDRERLDIESSLSAATRQETERQAKAMRTFLSEKSRLLPGSPEMARVIKEADHCTKLFQQTKTFASMQQA